MKPSLAVLITYHNEGKLLTRCLESFFRNGQGPDEVLVYDDASSLRPEAFIPQSLPVRVIRGEKNIGPARARNILWRESQADYIHFHDSDDWVLPGWNEAQRRPMAAGTDLILTEIESHREGRILSERVVGFPAELNGENFLSFAIRQFVLVPSSTIRRNRLEALGGYRESLWQSEDYDFYVRLAMSRPPLVLNSKALVAIEVRPESRSQNQTETYSSTLQALILLRKEVPSFALTDLAEKAAMVGSRLFQLGEKQLARDAFQLSAALGQADYSHQGPVFRWIAHRWGQEAAEQLGAWYRGVFPEKLRTRFR